MKSRSSLTSQLSLLFKREKNPISGLLTVEWIAMAYLVLTLIMMAVLHERLVNTEDMLKGRLQFVVVTLAVWGVYRLWSCRLTLFARIAVQMIFLSWWYPDTYELNRMLPNLDHVFASCEQALFGCQPALVFSQHVPWGWFSELMCLGYISYFPLMLLVLLYYFFRRYDEFRLASIVILGTFFVYYTFFILLPVTGPQFYYQAVGIEKIASGIFPNLGDWFLTHSQRMAAPGWSGGFFYHLLELTHDAGERPTAAFPSSHVGVTTVLLLLALRTRCRSFIMTVTVFYILMCFSTVYIFAHYAIDVIAGLTTGTLLYCLLIRTKKMGLR